MNFFLTRFLSSFYSGFLKIKPEILTGGNYFEISFEFKTDQLNALLLFAYDIDGKDFILVSLKQIESETNVIIHKFIHFI